jgi:hypothetical protein
LDNWRDVGAATVAPGIGAGLVADGVAMAIERRIPKKPRVAVCKACKKRYTRENSIQLADGNTYHHRCATMFPVFIMAELGVNYAYDWQKRIWIDCSPRGSRVALRAANGVGKTDECASCIALANCLIYPNSVTVVSSGVMRQVREQFWPAIRKHADPIRDRWGLELTSVGLECTLRGSKIVGFTASDTFKFEGFHSENLMVILDEAKSIKDDIFVAAERMQPARMLIQSSPGPAVGAFYRAFNSEKEYWKGHVIDYKMCPHLIAKKVRLANGEEMSWADSVIDRYGPNAPSTKSMLFGEWMDDEGQMLVCHLHWYNHCMEAAPARTRGEVALGIDVAAGGDENVVAIREGNEVRILDKWRDKDTYKAAVKIGEIIKRTGVPPEQCFLDIGGMGVGFADTLAAMGIHVSRVNFGGKAFDGAAFANRGTEMWMLASRRIERSEVRLPEDEELKSQMTTRVYKILDGGKNKLESKEEMRRRGLKSPDRADAVVMAMCGAGDMESLLSGPAYGEHPMDKLLSAFEAKMGEEENVIEGIDCGG